jgi:threonine/homoserine/homoserine lactone efflux protein
MIRCDMPPLETIAVYTAAALLLAVTPGPGILYVLARSLNGGRREGVKSSLGTAVGGSVHVMAAAFGLSAILAASATAFLVVKFAGAAYLVYLGVKMLLEKDHGNLEHFETPSSRGAFVQGIVTEVLNPKTALFFLSFIPQFVKPEHGSVVLQFLTLGAISVALNTTADLVVAFFAGPIGQRLRSSLKFRRGQRIVTGGAMISLGAYVAANR